MRRKKSLKALLQEHDIRFPRTHDVVVLARCSTPLLPELVTLEAYLDDLNVYAVEIRYAGLEVGQAKAQAALSAAEAVRQMVRHSLGLDASEGGG